MLTLGCHALLQPPGEHMEGAPQAPPPDFSTRLFLLVLILLLSSFFLPVSGPHVS